MKLKQEDLNPDGLGVDHSKPNVGAESFTALKDEIAVLVEENKNLAAQLSQTKNDRDTYRKMWFELDDKYRRLLTITKETVKLAGLA